MRICPCCPYTLNGYFSLNKNNRKEATSIPFCAKNQKEAQITYYDYLKNSVAFMGEKYKKSKSYLSSKFLFNSKEDSILTKGNKIRVDKTDYSREDVQNILSEKTKDANAQEFLVEHIMALISQDNPDSYYIKKILELVYANKLPPNVLLGLKSGLYTDENIKSDIDKLFECYRNGKNVADAFVTSFKTKESALMALSVGDICQIEDEDRISIKKSDTEIEKLFISKKTYLELFPPVERFLYTQSKQQNCYFIAVFDSIFSNPYSRYKILSLFHERKNGKTDATFGGYKYTGNNATNKDFSRYVLKDVSKQLNKTRIYNYDYMAYTTEGLRALELLSAQEARKNAESKINKKYFQYKKLLLQSEDDTILFNNFKYRRKELEDFISLYESSACAKTLISTEEMNIPAFSTDYGSILYGLKLLNQNDRKNADSKWERYILERYKEYLERTGKKTVPFREIIPFEAYQDIFKCKIDKNALSPYTYGGNSFSAFSTFNLPSIMLPLKDSEAADKILNLDDIEQKFVITCSTPNENHSMPDIEPFHSYSVTPSKKEGKRIFIVKNPINTTQIIELDKQELKRYFDTVELGLIEPSSFYLP